MFRQICRNLATHMIKVPDTDIEHCSLRLAIELAEIGEVFKKRGWWNGSEPEHPFQSSSFRYGAERMTLQDKMRIRIPLDITNGMFTEESESTRPDPASLLVRKAKSE
jgi:hypothetical protein